jgi:hypothetical protein
MPILTIPYSGSGVRMSGEKTDRELLEKMIDHLMIDSDTYVKWKSEVVMAIESLKIEYVNDFHKLKEEIVKQITETRLSHEKEFHPEIAKNPLELEEKKDKKIEKRLKWGGFVIGILGVLGGGGIVGILHGIFHFF